MSPETFTAAGERAARYLVGTPGWDTYPSVLAFISLQDEIDTMPAINAAHAAGKRCFVPRTDGSSPAFYRLDPEYRVEHGCLVQSVGRLNKPNPTQETLAPEDFPVLILTPGLAFDRSGQRLGRGKGWYDRFFTALERECTGYSINAPLPYTALGFCLDCQIVEEVPSDPWDKTVSGLITG